MNNSYFLALILFFTSSCVGFKEIKFEGVETVRFGEIKKGDVPILLDIKIDNPNRFPIKLKKGEADVFVNNQFLGTSSIGDGFTLEKSKTGIYTLKINTSFTLLSKAALSSLGALIGKEISLRIDGEIVVKAFAVRKKMDIDFSKPIKPSSILNI